MKPNEKFSEFITSKKSLPVLAGALCLGLFTVFLSNNSFKNKSDVDKFTSEQKPYVQVGDSMFDLKESSLEADLEQILSLVHCVGAVDVFVTYSSTSEDIALKDENKDGSKTTVMYNEASVSKPYISKKMYPQIEGVIVVAEGGDRADIKGLITDAVSAVLEIPVHKVKVLKMK